MILMLGKISFYMTSFGEHGCIVGSAAALSPEDWVYSQYREQGAHVWRGFTIDQVINQCIGNSKDAGKGRQMPVHYGCKELNNPTVSSPLSRL
jgi:2-oxoisovalerate dehydrogenase E1 component alpha subunit